MYICISICIMYMYLHVVRNSIFSLQHRAHWLHHLRCRAGARSPRTSAARSTSPAASARWWWSRGPRRAATACGCATTMTSPGRRGLPKGTERYRKRRKKVDFNRNVPWKHMETWVLGRILYVNVNVNDGFHVVEWDAIWSSGIYCMVFMSNTCGIIWFWFCLNMGILWYIEY